MGSTGGGDRQGQVATPSLDSSGIDRFAASLQSSSSKSKNVVPFRALYCGIIKFRGKVINNLAQLSKSFGECRIDTDFGAKSVLCYFFP